MNDTMPPSDRRCVLWVGEDRAVRGPFSERRLVVEELEPAAIETRLAAARALIISPGHGSLASWLSVLNDCARAALDHGIAIFLLVANDADFDPSADYCRKAGLGGVVQVEFRSSIIDVAESIIRGTNDIGPAPGPVTLVGDTVDLSATSKFLLTRAFHDCASIQIERIDGGYASECTLRVHAWLRMSQVGPRPMPFFVKAGAVKAIEGERSKYDQFAAAYIPFNLRPNLVPERCVRGIDRALLVGNLVEDAIPIRDALKTGQGATAIYSLFENTLRGFRMQPFTPGTAPVRGLHHFVKERCSIEKLRPDVAALAATLGLGRSPCDLANGLAAVAEPVSYRSGPYHGDLHAGNVLVRNRDAVVIDFASAGVSGPLTADPAALEVSLVFDGHDDEGFQEWREFVDQLFQSLPSLRPPVPEAKPSRFSWLYRAVREVRHVMFGLDISEVEAAVVLATYLVRFARLLQDPVAAPATSRQQRHAYALVIAERLLEAAQKR